MLQHIGVPNLCTKLCTKVLFLVSLLLHFALTQVTI